MKSNILNGLSIIVAVLGIVLPILTEKEDAKMRQKEISDEVQKQLSKVK